MIRTLLVDLPFSSVHRPSLALTILQGCLQDHGLACDLRHAKLAFASRIGVPLYREIAENTPHELLLGDFIFAGPLQDEPTLKSIERFKVATQQQAGGVEAVREDLWGQLPELRLCATRFLEELAGEISHLDYQVVGLNLTFQIAPAVAFARLLKKVAPFLRIVVGGAYCEGEMGIVLHQSFPWIDFVCRGEGEELLVNLISALESLNSPNAVASPAAAGAGFTKNEMGSTAASVNSIPGLVWRNGNASVANGDRAANIRDLDSLPIPQYTGWLDEVERSGLPLATAELSIPFESSRGCWFGSKMHCTFCGLPGPSLQFRSKSAGRVMVELRQISAIGVKNADAVDLIMDMRYFETLLPALASENLGLNIFYELKSNLNREQVRRLKAAGFGSVQPGIESLSSSLLHLMQKGVKAYQNVRLLKWLMEFGITTEWNLLYGFPNEDPAEYAQMSAIIPWLAHLQPPAAGCVRVLLSRFSPMFDHAEKLGIRNVAPVPAYACIFGSFCDAPSKLAYYFNFERLDKSSMREYLPGLRRAVETWRCDFGNCALVMLDRDGELHLFDSRPCAVHSEWRLVGEERAVYLACDSGATLQTICHELSLCPARTQSILDNLVESKLVIELDRHFLGLAVSLNEIVPQGTAGGLWRAICLAAYESIARRMAEPHAAQMLNTSAPRHEACVT
jgi:ribosomal peptide maturation radical SAM protein 1